MNVATAPPAPAPLHELLADLRHPGWGQPDWPVKFEELDAYQQVAIARIVAAFDAGHRLVLLDAPVGAGKTVIAEAVRRILRAGYTTYVCTDLALQAQFLNDFGYAANVMGAENYPTADFPERFEREPTDPMRVTAADCDLEHGRCTWCSPPVHIEYTDDWPKQVCPRRRAKAAAVTAPLSVTNIHYLLAECNHLGEGSEFSRLGTHGTGRELVVADEADSLERAIWTLEEVAVPPATQRLLGIDPPDRKTVPEAWERWCDEVALPAIAAILPDLAEQARFGDLMDTRRLERMRKLNLRLRAVRPLLANGHWVYDYEENKRETFIRFKPVLIDDIASRKLWEHSRLWLCMSATLLGRDVFCDPLGWQAPAAYVQMPSSFPVERRPIRYAPIADMGRKHREESWPKMARALEHLLDEHQEDRVLVHCVSYQLARYLVEHTDSTRLMTYASSKRRADTLDAFRTTPAAVLIAPSMERGIDLPYEDCRVCVVAQLNFLSLGDKQVAARSGGGRNLWYRIEMLRALVQAVGRVHRAADDESVTYILDARFWRIYRNHREFIPQWFREALVTTGDWSRRWSAA